MATYLVQTSYTQQALAAMVKKPQNRTEPIRKAVEKLGGSLVGLWLSFGKHDVVCMVEMPDNISAAAMAIAVGAGGAVPAFAGRLGAPSGGGKADGDAQPIGQGSAELDEGRPQAGSDIVEPAFAVGVLVGRGSDGHGRLLSRL